MTLANPEQPPQPASSQAITSLVLGILGFVSCCLLPVAPVAWYLGRQELRAIRAGLSPKEGESLANIGMILGIVGTLLIGMGLFWIFLFGGLTVLSAALSGLSH